MDDAVSVIALGLLVESSFNLGKVLVRLDEVKAQQWLSELLENLSEECLHSSSATKLAGRMSWSLSSSRSKAGRGYLKALFAQANKPLPQGRISLRLHQALCWIARYLQVRPPALYFGLDEAWDHVRTWSDASGVDRLIAVVMLIGNSWHYTVVEVPRFLFESFLQRGDNQIGMMELLAPILALGTWPDVFGLCVDCVFG